MQTAEKLPDASPEATYWVAKAQVSATLMVAAVLSKRE
jgi:hypothetical protein